MIETLKSEYLFERDSGLLSGKECFMRVHPALQSEKSERDLLISLKSAYAVNQAILWSILWVMYLFLGIQTILLAISVGKVQFFHVMIVIGFLLFSVVVQRTILRPFHPHDPLIRINIEGITIRKLPEFIGDIDIPWETIEEICSVKMLSETYIGIKFKNARTCLRQIPFWKQWLLRFHSRRGIYRFFLQEELSMSIEDIFHQILSRYGEQLKEYNIHLENFH